MVSKKVIIGAVVVVAIIAVVAIAISGGSDDPEARYNYKVELAPSFQWTGESGTSYDEVADAGMQYAIVTYVVYNDSYDKGVSTNLMTWVWTVSAENLKYTSDFDTYSHPGYRLVDVGVGGHATQVIVFQVPATLSVDDLTVSQDYQWTFDPPKLKLDTALSI